MKRRKGGCMKALILLLPILLVSCLEEWDNEVVYGSVDMRLLTGVWVDARQTDPRGVHLVEIAAGWPEISSPEGIDTTSVVWKPYTCEPFSVDTCWHYLGVGAAGEYFVNKDTLCPPDPWNYSLCHVVTKLDTEELYAKPF